MNMIDVTNWQVDDLHGIFQVGARDKAMLWSPKEYIRGVKKKWPYLFKESRRRYPEQFWIEVVAYVISKHLKIEVPVSLPAKRELDGEITYGSLSKWFYDYGNDEYISGGDLLKSMNPSFDNKKGTQHNLLDLITILEEKSIDNYMIWVADMALFAAIIGDSDRHQDNWGIVSPYNKNKNKMSPLFDNGTSMGHEHSANTILGWNKERLSRYIKNGHHHLRHTRKETKKQFQHLELIVHLCNHYGLGPYMEEKIKNIKMNSMLTEIKTLTEISCNVPFTIERFNSIELLLNARIALIRGIL